MVRQQERNEGQHKERQEGASRVEKPQERDLPFFKLKVSLLPCRCFVTLLSLPCTPPLSALHTSPHRLPQTNTWDTSPPAGWVWAWVRVVPSRSLGTEESTWGGRSLGFPSCGYHTCHMALSAWPPWHPGSVTPPPPDLSADPPAQVHNPWITQVSMPHAPCGSWLIHRSPGLLTSRGK